ncbi:MAG TPA: LuxR C-terminal-related transcriptional regulator [Methylomirabilota bacterium]|nr:LuxR C-terminal-related transcriptional regulator [Methylomirabilota bacterium]
MSKRRKILIVDRDEVFCSTTAAVLEREGYACVSSLRAEGVIEQITREAYDLLLVDISELNPPSYVMLDALCAQAKGFPLIVMTRHPSLDSALRAIQWQVNAYLIKPFEIQQLLTEIHKALTQTALYKFVQQLQHQWRKSHEATQTRTETRPAAFSAPAHPVEVQLTAASDLFSRSFTAGQNALSFRPPFIEHGSRVSPSLSGCREQATKNGQIDHSTIIRQAQVEKKPGRLEPSDTVRARLQLLSQREWEVVQLLLANQRPKMIARTLFISLHTVRNHLRSIFDKLAVHSQTELLVLLGRYAHLPILQAETDGC